MFQKMSHFSPRSGKIPKIFWGRIPPDLPTSTYDTTPNFLSDKFLKKPCVQIISLYEDMPWVRVGQMLHCKVVTHNISFLRSFNHIWLNHIHQGKAS